MIQIAESGMFHTWEPGKTKIDTAKQAKLYDALLWASMKHDHDEAEKIYYDMMDSKVTK